MRSVPWATININISTTTITYSTIYFRILYLRVENSVSSTERSNDENVTIVISRKQLLCMYLLVCRHTYGWGTMEKFSACTFHRNEMMIVKEVLAAQHSRLVKYDTCVNIQQIFVPAINTNFLQVDGPREHVSSPRACSE